MLLITMHYHVPGTGITHGHPHGGWGFYFWHKPCVLCSACLTDFSAYSLSTSSTTSVRANACHRRALWSPTTRQKWQICCKCGKVVRPCNANRIEKAGKSKKMQAGTPDHLQSKLKKTFGKRDRHGERGRQDKNEKQSTIDSQQLLFAALCGRKRRNRGTQTGRWFGHAMPTAMST